MTRMPFGPRHHGSTLTARERRMARIAEAGFAPLLDLRFAPRPSASSPLPAPTCLETVAEVVVGFRRAAGLDAK